MVRPIVVGVGADGTGIHAARFAAGLAQRCGAVLLLVFGYEASPLGPRGGPLEAQIKAIGDEATSQVRTTIGGEFPGLDVEIELVPDRPVESLVRVAQARDAEMIVVGHGGAGPLRAALLGSTTYELVHRAPVPILVVPDAEE